MTPGRGVFVTNTTGLRVENGITLEVGASLKDPILDCTETLLRLPSIVRSIAALRVATNLSDPNSGNQTHSLIVRCAVWHDSAFE